MIEQPHSPERWKWLLAELLDGRLTDEQTEELRTLVGADPAAREFYVRHILTHAMLQWEHAGLDAPEIERGAALPPLGGPTTQLPTTAPIANHLSGPPTWFGVSWFGGVYGSPKTWLLVLGFVVLVGSLAVGLTLWPRVGVPDVGGQNIAKHPALPANQANPATPIAGQAAATTPSVARLTLADGYQWQDGEMFPGPGDPLAVGQTLRLASGVVEITFDIGVRMILQGPATLQVEAEKEVRLSAGKLTAEILKPEASGFAVQTPNGKVVDLGTEFGVEVTPSQDIQVHVFKGEVVVHPAAGEGTLPAQHLTGNQGLRLGANSSVPVLVADPGESFIRSISEARRDQHVVAYWRFEDRPLGVLLPDTDGNRLPVCATSDSSFNGNDLYAGTAINRPTFSADVPDKVVAQTNHPNLGCLDTSQPKTEINRLNLYTHSQFSHAAPLDIQKIAPKEWTIEASVKAAKLFGKEQGFLGRDTNYTAEENRAAARLTFQINANDRFAIGFYDASDRYHEAVADEPRVEVGQWYHVAATSDGRVLRLFVDALDGRGYIERATKKLPEKDSTALGKGQDAAEWTLGRAGNAGDPANWLRFWGWIDEVRISDLARGPTEFLFAPRELDQEQKNNEQQNDNEQEAENR